MDVIARAERRRNRNLWLANTLPKLRAARIFETLAEEACKALGYGELSCSLSEPIDGIHGGFNICFFVEVSADAAALERLPARGRWALRVPFIGEHHVVEKLEAEVATMQ